jgi:hypothetical protein
LTQLEEVLEQDPLNVPFRAISGLILAFAELHEPAQVEARAAANIDSDHWLPHFAISVSHVLRGAFSEAREPAERSVRAAPWNPQPLGLFVGILARLRGTFPVNDLLLRLAEMPPTGLFLYHSLCANTAAALDCYAKMIDQHEPAALWYASTSFLKPLRSSPRWPALAKIMNLPGEAH